jgi:hypothetical protein
MTSIEPRIDIARLEKVRRTGTKIVARCPACAAAGGDRTGDHFYLDTATGKFGCGACPGASEHRREIFRLVGINGDRRPDPARDRRWRETRDRERRAADARRRLTGAATVKRAAIVASDPWHAVDVWEDSRQRIDCDLVEFDSRHFLQSLFPFGATVWTGEVYQSGTRHADRWQNVGDLQAWPVSEIGPMVSPAIWKPGTTSRTAAGVIASPYTVLDFDGLDGQKPTTPAEIEKHIADSLAIVRWIREGLGWQLAAMIRTGNVSIHAWFVTPPDAVLQSIRTIAPQLGIDAGLIGHPEHPARLPGQIHSKSNKRSRVLWLQEPIP